MILFFALFAYLLAMFYLIITLRAIFREPSIEKRALKELAELERRKKL